MVPTSGACPMRPQSRQVRGAVTRGALGRHANLHGELRDMNQIDRAAKTGASQLRYSEQPVHCKLMAGPVPKAELSTVDLSKSIRRQDLALLRLIYTSRGSI